MGLSEDDIPTRRIQKVTWLPPVRSTDQLPIDGVLDGTLCFVEGDGADAQEEVWEFSDGGWRRIDTL